MSKYYQNECVECGKPCIYENCQFYQVEHCCCDFCGRSDEDVKMIISNEQEDICEDCKNRIDYKNNQILEDTIYNFYVNDWLKTRNLTKKDLDEFHVVKYGPYANTTYACKGEFLDNEYQEDDIVDYLCQENGYKNFRDMVQEYGLEDYIYG